MLLEINNAIYSGFSSLSVFTSMETLSDTFTITANNRWISDYSIKANSTARVLTDDGESLLDGYIYGLEPEIGEPITIHGRDKTGDLIDCTVIGSTGEFKGRTLKQIIESLVSPFGITVSGESGSVIPIYRHAQNAKVSDVIFDLVSRQGLLANSDGTGNIELTTATTTERAPISLREGVNITSGKAIISTASQYSSYKVIGQNADLTQISATQTGDSPRTRPLTIINSGSIQLGDAKSFALWRKNVSDGSAQGYKIEVDGIQNIRPNTLIETASNTLGVNGDLIIKSATFISDETGNKTAFDLVPPQTYGGNITLNSWIG